MKKENNSIFRKILGIVCIIVLVVNIVLRLGYKLYSDIIFWLIIGIIALIAWPIMNYLKR
jgi:uncharacterized membrane protein